MVADQAEGLSTSPSNCSQICIFLNSPLNMSNNKKNICKAVNEQLSVQVCWTPERYSPSQGRVPTPTPIMTSQLMVP